MKLYKRVENKSGRAYRYIPAPQAERLAQLGRVVQEAMSDGMDAEYLRRNARYCRDTGAGPAAPSILNAIAAWIENSQKGDKNVDQS